MTMFWGAWIGLTVGFVVLAGALGWALRDQVWGIVLDERETVSLARVQLVAWTLVGTPLVLAMAMWRLTVAGPRWDLGVPGQLVAFLALGLGGSAIAAVLDRPDGDEAGTPRRVDVMDVQSVAISAGLLVAYVWTVIAAYVHVPITRAPASLPVLNPSWLAVLALSQAGYVLSVFARRGVAEAAVDGPMPSSPSLLRMT